MRILLISLFCSLFTLSSWASAYEANASLVTIQNQFASSIASVKSALKNPKIDGLTRLRLAYDPNPNTEQKIAEILVAYEAQLTVISHYWDRNQKEKKSIYAEATNSLAAKTVLSLVKARLGYCGDCSEDQKPRLGEAAGYFMNILDLNDMRNGFSGLPFYQLIRHNWSLPKFKQQVLQFFAELEKILSSYVSTPHYKFEKTVYDVALTATNGDSREAIELLAILLGRDIGVTRYLKYFYSADESFVYAFGLSSIYVKLIATLQNYHEHTDLDYFSYPKEAESAMNRSYYFWTSAYVSQKLRELGIGWPTVKLLNIKFVQVYKSIRFIQSLTKSSEELPYVSVDASSSRERHRKDTVKTARAAYRGAKFGFSIGEHHAEPVRDSAACVRDLLNFL